jgi:hypothetical protein
MSVTTFVEAASSDPFVRELHRRAVRLLNDPSLDRRGREFHMGQLQSILLEHLKKEEARAARGLAKKAMRAGAKTAAGNRGVADPSQVVARRKEFSAGSEGKSASASVGAPDGAAEGVKATGSQRTTGRNRPVLSLKRG